MKFQVNIEVDETKSWMKEKDVIDFVLDKLSGILEEQFFYYDIGVHMDSIVNGLTS